MKGYTSSDPASMLPVARWFIECMFIVGWMAEAISTKYGLEISKEEALEKLWALNGKTWLSW